MSDELRAAAERMRATKYPGNVDIADRNLLALAYVAERRADDDELITAPWIRNATSLPVCKNGSDGYSDSDVTLFLDDWESRNSGERFWCLSFRDDETSWRVSVSVQENHRHGGTLYMANVKTRGDVRRLFSALGIELKESK